MGKVYPSIPWKMDETGRIYYDSCFDFPRKVEKWKAIVGASNDNERCVSSRIPKEGRASSRRGRGRESWPTFLTRVIGCDNFPKLGPLLPLRYLIRQRGPLWSILGSKVLVLFIEIPSKRSIYLLIIGYLKTFGKILKRWEEYSKYFRLFYKIF